MLTQGRRSRLGVIPVAGLVLVLSGCRPAEMKVFGTEEVPGILVNIWARDLPGHRYWPVYYEMIRIESGERYQSEAVYFIDRDVVDRMDFLVQKGLREGEYELVWTNRPPGVANAREFHPFLLLYPKRFFSYPRQRGDREDLGQRFVEETLPEAWGETPAPKTESVP